MALIICPECNTPFSEYSSNCSNCNCPLEIAKKEYNARIEYLRKRKEGEKLKYEAKALELVQKSVLDQVKRESIFEKYAEKISMLEAKIKEETSDFEQKRKAEISSLMEQYLTLERDIGEQETRKKQIELDIVAAGFFQFGRKRELKEALTTINETLLKARRDQKDITSRVDNLNAECPSTLSIKEKKRLEKERDSKLKKLDYDSIISKETALLEISDDLIRPLKSINVRWNKCQSDEIHKILDTLGAATISQMVELSYILELTDESVIYELLEAMKKSYIEEVTFVGIPEVYYRKCSSEKIKRISEQQQQELEEEVKKSQEKLFDIQQKLVELQNPQQKPKQASVIGRGIAGAAIAGPAGAIVGALSAIDKNNHNNEK